MRVTDSFFLVHGLEFLLSYVGTEATQKGRFDSGWAYFSSNFLYRRSFLVVMAASWRSRQGLRRFAAVMAEVFAPSWWSRRRSFIHRHKNNAKNRFTCDFRLFHHRNLLGVCASSRHLRRQAIFSGRNHRKKEEKSRKKATSTGRGRWSCGGLRRAALEVTAVFCGHGRWFILEVFLGFSIWRLKRHNP